MLHDKELNAKYSDLEGQIELNKSILNNIQSTPLTEGYEIVNTPEYQDALTFFDDELESAEDELDFSKKISFLETSLMRQIYTNLTVFHH